MEKLLQWSIANQSDDKEVQARAPKPDPELLSQLFGQAADEPTLMKQNMAVIVSPEIDLENKLVAFDNFEMLIENLDNANNIENLELWEPLLSQLSSPENQLQALACSCIGTAAQNNPKSQKDFLKYAETENGTAKLVELALTSTPETKLKAIYALANIVRHNEKGVESFEKHNGWEVIAPILNNTSSPEKLKLRALSLLNASLSTSIDKSKLKKLQQDGVVSSLLKLIKVDGHIGCIDSATNIVTTLISHKYTFDAEEKKLLSQAVEQLEAMKDQISHEDLQRLKSVL
ncbi:hypothetical protein OGAPHI_007187 [Ogataea philodendri]|uniref:Hsp70 nucleotide exchange factor FES1 n=1 Tax=Ogataea philodendri TaxID=1378263 RepID=A0A9P8NVH0_9ASCO|nr:uncharacterized protein OGAPHI_007187 [Ogataea philodendri]KAH3659982.1 hypothetical protein OGAPHI_007187 [Ogataea philodendri]